MLDLVYEDAERRGSVGLPFEDIVELVLSIRGSNPATLKDVKEASAHAFRCGAAVGRAIAAGGGEPEDGHTGVEGGHERRRFKDAALGIAAAEQRQGPS
ncbi:unnamed protein product [Effrenium voratum]|nr:unnamed protein product [Effrenium voratum]